MSTRRSFIIRSALALASLGALAFGKRHADTVATADYEHGPWRELEEGQVLVPYAYAPDFADATHIAALFDGPEYGEDAPYGGEAPAQPLSYPEDACDLTTLSEYLPPDAVGYRLYSRGVYIGTFTRNHHRLPNEEYSNG